MTSHRFDISFGYWLRTFGLGLLGFLLLLIAALLWDAPSSDPPDDPWMQQVVMPFTVALIPCLLIYVHSQIFAVIVTEEGITCNTWYGGRRMVQWKCIKSVSWRIGADGRVPYQRHHGRRPPALLIESSCHEEKLHIATYLVYAQSDFYDFVERYTGSNHPLKVYLKKHPHMDSLWYNQG